MPDAQEAGMLIETPSGETWNLVDIGPKLARRGALPGASLFERAVLAQRAALRARVTVEDRLALAWSAGWLVNSPAISRVLQRWSLAPQHDVWLALADETAGDARQWLAGRSAERAEDLASAMRALGSEPYVIEAVSKVLALVSPDVVPLMPVTARAFVLGPEQATRAASFGAMLDWLAEASLAHEPELADAGAALGLSAAQVLDRMLWFDSEGHRSFDLSGPQAVG